ncbi:hypothetical protein HK102_004901 [Quaeritorhiza haematococci]|nr:hypothetical protein HK102_004901 [Quaeritorhiza haematococci]
MAQIPEFLKPFSVLVRQAQPYLKPYLQLLPRNPILLCLTVFALYILLRLTKFVLGRLIFYARLPYPVAHGKVPFLGAPVEFGMNGLQFLRRKHKELGNVFLIDILFVKFHFVLGAKAIEKVYKAPREQLCFVSGVPQIMPELVEDAWADKSFDYVGKVHPSILQGFTDKKRLEWAYRLIVEEADKAFDRWVEMDKIDIYKECSRLVVLVTLRFLFGDEIYNKRGEEIALLYDQLEADLAHPLVMTLRPLPTAPYRRLIKNRNTLLQICMDVVKARINNPSEYKDDMSFVKFLMDEHGTQFGYQYGYMVLGVILATRTNTAGVLAWTTAHLCDNQDLMKRVISELEENGCMKPKAGDINDPDAPSYPLNKLFFIDACMKETIRSYSNYMQFRQVMCEGGWEIEPGKIIPKGELVCISPAESHHDESVFEDPYTYKPERWLDNDYWATRSRAMAFVQWGFLKHRCYGEKFAQQFDKTVWARLFSRYTVESADPKQKVPEQRWGSGFGTSSPVEGETYYVTVRKRKE